MIKKTNKKIKKSPDLLPIMYTSSFMLEENAVLLRIVKMPNNRFAFQINTGKAWSDLATIKI